MRTRKEIEKEFAEINNGWGSDACKKLDILFPVLLDIRDLLTKDNK